MIINKYDIIINKCDKEGLKEVPNGERVIEEAKTVWLVEKMYTYIDVFVYT
jgi:hypothetical protein